MNLRFTGINILNTAFNDNGTFFYGLCGGSIFLAWFGSDHFKIHSCQYKYGVTINDRNHKLSVCDAYVLYSQLAKQCQSKGIRFCDKKINFKKG